MYPSIGNGRIDAIQPYGTLTLSDTTQPCLAISWSSYPVPGELQTVIRHAATVTVAPTGSDDSKLLITLKVKRRNFGTDLADLRYTIDVGAAQVDWSGTTATAATFKDVADLISDLEGFKCFVLNAPHGASVNSDNFVALAETYVQSAGGVHSRQTFLYRDVSEYTDANSDKVAWMRIGLPEKRDNNPLRLLKVSGTCTGDTNGVVRIYRDTAAHGAETPLFTGTLAEAQTSYLDYTIENAPTVQGPLILEVASDDLSVCNIDTNIQQALLGA